MHTSFHDSIALRLDHSTRQFETVPLRDLSWSIADAGTLHGAILVERFRTYGCRLLDLADHKVRLSHGASQFAIDDSSIAFDLEENANRLLESNRDLVHRCDDVSVVVLLSPGVQLQNNILGSRPTCMMHLSPLPFTKLARWYTQGTHLSIGSYRAVPGSCWPNQMKSRSRLPYFLSDAEATATQSDSLAVLTTTRGSISDTSAANLLLVDGKGEFVSPPKEDILVGCTLQSIERLLNTNRVRIHYRDIEPKELLRASEIILTGSSGGIWPARSIDGTRIGSGSGRPKLRMLTELWKEHVGMDFVSQATTKQSIG